MNILKTSLAYIMVALLLSCCGGEAVPEEIMPPAIPSVSATVDGRTIVLTAEFKSGDSLEGITEYGFYFGYDENKLECLKVKKSNERAYSLIKDRLEYSTSYFYSAWVSNGRDEIASDPKTVKTGEAPVDPDPPVDGIIQFKDPTVKAICVANWDLDGDGELSKAEATEVMDLGEVFRGKSITSFDELEYFSALDRICASAFRTCLELVSVKLPPYVTCIEWDGFYGCEKMKSIDLPLSLRTIGRGAFAGCYGLAIEHLPENVESIDLDAFSECHNLRLTELPPKLTELAVNAFNNCWELNISELPSGLTNINQGVFFHNKKISLTALPDGVKTIGLDAFTGCTDLCLKSLPSNLISIDDGAFSECTSLRLEELPNTLQEIGAKAFYRCKKIKVKKLPDNLTSIKEYTFAGCIGITSVVLPSELLTISSNAFEDCRFNEITIPAKVARIDTDAFKDCYWLATVKMLPETPPELSDENIGNYADVIYVPAASLEKYRTASGWSRWKDKFQPIPSE